MKTRYGKWYARWTGPDGKRHEKAFASKRAAKHFQQKMQRERETKKDQRPAPTSAKSHGRSRKPQRGIPSAPSPKNSKRKLAV
ncbi:MAG: hypothetical protein JSS69_05765 [Acidobacteria bacterium]|nr:hypothetical protein [Acidobacteriota bacterium]MBS1865408.1 hypothetical protein [Acidobacteriota bacterium]